MTSRAVTACKTAVTILCGGVGFALEQACAAGSDGKGGLAAGMAAGNILQGIVSNYGKDAADMLAGEAAAALGASVEARNHDLDALAALAIQKCLAIAAHQGQLSDVAPDARRLSGASIEQIATALRRPEFADVDDVALLGLVGLPQEGVGTTTLSSDYWVRFVEALGVTLPEVRPRYPVNLLSPSSSECFLRTVRSLCSSPDLERILKLCPARRA